MSCNSIHTCDWGQQLCSNRTVHYTLRYRVYCFYLFSKRQLEYCTYMVKSTAGNHNDIGLVFDVRYSYIQIKRKTARTASLLTDSLSPITLSSEVHSVILILTEARSLPIQYTTKPHPLPSSPSTTISPTNRTSKMHLIKQAHFHKSPKTSPPQT